MQIPGPTNCPDRILRAMNRQVIDHRGHEFAEMALEIQEGIRGIFKTKGHVVIYPGSGSGAWEAAMVNALSQGDRVLTFDIGHFADMWRKMAVKLGSCRRGRCRVPARVPFR